MKRLEVDLLETYLDGTLPGEEVARLEDRLKAEPELAEALVRFAQEDAVIREWAQVTRAAAEARQAAAAVAPPLVNRGFRPRPRHWVALGCGVAAAVIFVIFSVKALLPQRAPQGTPVASKTAPAKTAPSKIAPSKIDVPAPVKIAAAPVARLTHVQGSVWRVPISGEPAVVDGPEDLFAGQEVRTGYEGSQAVVKYADGTQFDLYPDTVVRFDADNGTDTVGKQVFLQSGLVEADVAPQPKDRPMMLRTPHVTIRVLGTRFSSAASVDSTRIEMEEGQVEMTRVSDSQSIMLKTNCFAVVSPGIKELIAQPLPPQSTEPRLIIADLGSVSRLVFAKDGDTLAIAHDGNVLLWDIPKGRMRANFPVHSRRVKALAYSPDGTILATGGLDKSIHFWDPATGAPQPISFPKQPHEIEAIAFTSDGSLLATAPGAGKSSKGADQVALWDPRTGKLAGKMAGQIERVVNLAISPDGKTMATVARDGTVKLWDLATRAERFALGDQTRDVHALAFSPDSRRLATGGKDQVIRIWDLTTQKVLTRLEGNTCDVRALVFSPDNRRLASAGHDKMVRLWDVNAGRELRALKGHRKRSVQALAFSPDGRLLATGAADKQVILWDVGKE